MALDNALTGRGNGRDISGYSFTLKQNWEEMAVPPYLRRDG